ncbi:hypothetical protein HanIR_Chr11g0546061 [Helianthus annuus]|nr:hypothetical protein HanIR_Chr11g0546061 [Helianthus annuus]
MRLTQITSRKCCIDMKALAMPMTNERKYIILHIKYEYMKRMCTKHCMLVSRHNPPELCFSPIPSFDSTTYVIYSLQPQKKNIYKKMKHINNLYLPGKKNNITNYKKM